MRIELADEIVKTEILPALAPHCERIEVAGSVRRRRQDVGDIEIVCIPRQTPYIDLFGTQTEPVPEFVGAVNLWQKIKGEPTGRYTQRQLPYGGPVVDIFIARPENWGLIFAIRTGSARFSYEVLATGWTKAGYNSVDGMLTRRSDGEQVQVREERDLFELIKAPWREPTERE